MFIHAFFWWKKYKVWRVSYLVAFSAPNMASEHFLKCDCWNICSMVDEHINSEMSNFSTICSMVDNTGLSTVGKNGKHHGFLQTFQDLQPCISRVKDFCCPGFLIRTKGQALPGSCFSRVKRSDAPWRGEAKRISMCGGGGHWINFQSYDFVVSHFLNWNDDP